MRDEEAVVEDAGDAVLGFSRPSVGTILRQAGFSGVKSRGRSVGVVVDAGDAVLGFSRSSVGTVLCEAQFSLEEKEKWLREEKKEKWFSSGQESCRK